MGGTVGAGVTCAVGEWAGWSQGCWDASASAGFQGDRLSEIGTMSMGEGGGAEKYK